MKGKIMANTENTDPLDHDEQEPVATAYETKEEAFVRLANYRMGKAIKRIRQMKNLASANYSYTDDQAYAVCDHLHNEVNKLADALISDNDDELPTI